MFLLYKENNNSEKILIGVSARHIHLSQEHVDILFGENYTLKKYKELYQVGEFACHEKLSVVTENGEINNVRVIGPTRQETQVEISKSDTRRLKIDPPVRNSGCLEGSSAIILKGPNGIVELKQGCIIATRHIHVSPEDAKILNVKNGEIVSVSVDGEKGGIMNNVYIKVKDNNRLEMHIDVDDANAFLLSNKDFVKLVKSQ